MTADQLTWFGSAMAFAFAMSATPGPNNAMLTASGATFGLRRTVAHMLGIATGFPIMVFAVGLGAGEVLRDDPFIQEGLRWAGACYMLWLAAKIARAEPTLGDTAPAGAEGQPLSFIQAALFQWINPKAWVTAIGAVVTYTTGDPVLAGKPAILAAMFLAISLPVTFCWTLVGVGAARLLRTRLALRRFNRAMAALLVASLIPLLLGE